jgi:hypothetical protein
LHVLQPRAQAEVFAAPLVVLRDHQKDLLGGQHVTGPMASAVLRAQARLASAGRCSLMV